MKNRSTEEIRAVKAISKNKINNLEQFRNEVAVLRKLVRNVAHLFAGSS